MTRMLLAAALATALATALGATLPAGAAQAKDTLTVGMVLEPPHLDPTAGAASAIREVTYANIYEGLTRIDAPWRGAGRRSRKAGSISPDGLTYTFRLHRRCEIPRRHAVRLLDREVLATSAPSPPTASTRRSSCSSRSRAPTCPDALTAVVTLKRPTVAVPVRHGRGAMR